MSSFPHLQSATTSDSTSWPEEAAQRVHGRTVNQLVQRSSSVTSSWPEVAAQRIPGRTETRVVQRTESATSTAEDEQTDPGSVSFTLRLERRESSQITTCPLSAHVAILTSGGAEILRFPSNLSNGDVEGLTQFETEKYADAILRWPYCVLITAARSRVSCSGQCYSEKLQVAMERKCTNVFLSRQSLSFVTLLESTGSRTSGRYYTNIPFHPLKLRSLDQAKWRFYIPIPRLDSTTTRKKLLRSWLPPADEQAVTSNHPRTPFLPSSRERDLAAYTSISQAICYSHVAEGISSFGKRKLRAGMITHMRSLVREEFRGLG